MFLRYCTNEPGLFQEGRAAGCPMDLSTSKSGGTTDNWGLPSYTATSGYLQIELLCSCIRALRFVVVALLFYVHGKHLRSCRDGQLTEPHFSWAGLDLLSG